MIDYAHVYAEPCGCRYDASTLRCVARCPDHRTLRARVRERLWGALGLVALVALSVAVLLMAPLND